MCRMPAGFPQHEMLDVIGRSLQVVIVYLTKMSQNCGSDVLRESSMRVGKPLVVVVWITTQSFLDITFDLLRVRFL